MTASDEEILSVGRRAGSWLPLAVAGVVLTQGLCTGWSALVPHGGSGAGGPRPAG